MNTKGKQYVVFCIESPMEIDIDPNDFEAYQEARAACRHDYIFVGNVPMDCSQDEVVHMYWELHDHCSIDDISCQEYDEYFCYSDLAYEYDISECINYSDLKRKYSRLRKTA